MSFLLVRFSLFLPKLRVRLHPCLFSYLHDIMSWKWLYIQLVLISFNLYRGVARGNYNKGFQRFNVSELGELNVSELGELLKYCSVSGLVMHSRPYTLIPDTLIGTILAQNNFSHFSLLAELSIGSAVAWGSVPNGSH